MPPLLDRARHGLLSVFFLVVGLEIKREFTVGHLSTLRSGALPVIAAFGGMAVGGGWVAVKDRLFPPHRIEGEALVCQAADVPVDGTFPFTVAGSKIPFILIHLNDGSWRAFEQKCTHLSCAVFYQPAADKIQCPCHNGWFDARTGTVLQGPPPRPLKRLEVVIKDGQIYVTEPRST